jgi:hypothetical protein
MWDDPDGTPDRVKADAKAEARQGSQMQQTRHPLDHEPARVDRNDQPLTGLPEHNISRVLIRTNEARGRARAQLDSGREMSRSRARLVDALWSLVPSGADDDTLIRVNPSALAADVGCSPEEVGAWLSELNAGWTKIREPHGRRMNLRTVRMKHLPPLPSGRGHRERGPTGDAETPLPIALKAGPELSLGCRRRGANLPTWARYLEVCGDCLTDAKLHASIRPIPRPGYGGAADTPRRPDEPLSGSQWVGPVPTPGYR